MFHYVKYYSVFFKLNQANKSDCLISHTQGLTDVTHTCVYWQSAG